MASTIVLIIAGKVVWWRLKLVSERLMKNRVSIQPLGIPQPDIDYKGKNSNFTVGKSSGHHLNQIKLPLLVITHIDLVYLLSTAH